MKHTYGGTGMIKGIGSSDGYGIGKVIIIEEPGFDFVPKTDCVPLEELGRYQSAVEKFCEMTNKIAEKVRQSSGKKEADIILGHILMIQDPFMKSEIEKLIQNGQCAENALSSVCDMFACLFSSADDELTKQRASDVNDVKNSILSILLEHKEIDLSELPPETIIAAKDLTPSMTAGMDKDNVSGIITETGGKTSHSAIIARAMGIPAVSNAENAVLLLKDGDTVIIDGVNGVVIDGPSEEDILEYRKKQTEFIEEKKSLSGYINRKTLTNDGISLKLFGNIGNPNDTDAVIKSGGEGIGLFRTEFLFMDRNSYPDENTQFNEYVKTAVIMRGKPVIIRTLDVGGDKNIPYLGIEKEENPFLGFRAIRWCLKNKELFTIQLRALIRASAFGNIMIMIPFVTCVDELIAVKKMISDIMTDFDSKNIAYNKNLKTGVMIETAAAAATADILAKEADFFSIGTNDLTQYIMSADRGIADNSYLCSVFNPAVLRTIRHVISEAKKAGIPVGVCGESASDRLMIPLLISFGLDEFSVGAASMLKTRSIISQWTKKSADELAQKIMKLKTEKEVIKVLEENT